MTKNKFPDYRKGHNRTPEAIAEEIRTKQESTTDIIDIGGLLTEAQRGLEHGDWLPWLERELDYPERTAQRYIKAFEFAERIKSVTVTDFSPLTPTALYLLSEDAHWKKGDRADYREEASNAVLDVVRHHEKVDSGRAKHIIEETIAKLRPEDEAAQQAAEAGVAQGATASAKPGKRAKATVRAAKGTASAGYSRRGAPQPAANPNTDAVLVPVLVVHEGDEMYASAGFADQIKPILAGAVDNTTTTAAAFNKFITVCAQVLPQMTVGDLHKALEVLYVINDLKLEVDWERRAAEQANRDLLGSRYCEMFGPLC